MNTSSLAGVRPRLTKIRHWLSESRPVLDRRVRARERNAFEIGYDAGVAGLRGARREVQA